MAKPVVDGLEKTLADRIPVIRLDTRSDVGRSLASIYGIRGIPTLLVLDGRGQIVVSQVGRIDRDQVLEAIDHLTTVIK